MSDVPEVTGLQFHYSDVAQGTPQWLADKRGRIGASLLYKWLAVSKAAKTKGQPLKARLDYEKELMYERQFDVSFEHYVNSAMQEGVEFEDWIAQEFTKITGDELVRVGVWFNEFFAASPDRKKADVPAGVEIKKLMDNSFREVLENKKVMADNDWETIERLADSSSVKKHWTQIQGQLWATGWDYVDYAPANFNTKQLAIIRIEPSKAFHEYLALSVQEKLVVAKFDMANVHTITTEIPEGLIMPGGDDNNSDGGWA